MSGIRKVASVAAGIALCMAAAAADRVWHPYRDVCENLGLAKLHAVPAAQRDHVRILFKLPADDPALRNLVLTIASRQNPRLVTPDTTGAIEFPYDEQLLGENPDVLVNLPPGKKVSLEVDLRPVAPGGLETSYADLMTGVDQANALIRKQAGMLSIFAPTLRSLVLQYSRAEGQTVTIGAGAAQKRITVDAQGKIVIPYESALAAENPRVRLSALPASVDFDE